MNFSISDWFYWGDVFIDQTQKIPLSNQTLDLSNIPAMQRRRLPLVARRINQFALKAKTHKIPLIYVSSHGEISRTLSIIRSFDNDVSPMQFSLSVHNAIAGLLSVAHDNKQSYQAIDSLSGGIETAVVEAMGLFTMHEQVAIVYYDEAFPKEYHELYDSNPLPPATVLVLTVKRGTNYCIERQASVSMGYKLATDTNNVQALVDFIQDTEQKSLLNTYANCAWRWERS